jgi:hypothetical protein
MFFPNDITHLRFTRSAELDLPTTTMSNESMKMAQRGEAVTL